MKSWSFNPDEKEDPTGMSNAEKEILMTSMSKQIINEMGHKQCIILNLKMKKIKRQNPSQQVSNNSAAVA